MFDFESLFKEFTAAFGVILMIGCGSLIVLAIVIIGLISLIF